jgi:cytochrome bd-type quinol oxidase subunit 2
MKNKLIALVFGLLSWLFMWMMMQPLVFGTVLDVVFLISILGFPLSLASVIITIMTGFTGKPKADKVVGVVNLIIASPIVLLYIIFLYLIFSWD